MKISPIHKKKKSPNLSKRPNQVDNRLASELRQINKNESTYAAWETRYKGTYQRGDGWHKAGIKDTNSIEKEIVFRR